MSPDRHRPTARSDNRGGFQRLAQGRNVRVDVKIDGNSVLAYAGETLLTVLMADRGDGRLSNARQVGGFCLIGACQECWADLSDGTRVRTCSTYARDGLNVISGVAT